MISKNNLPAHVAIIMDGNGRWAKKNGLSRTSGHREGLKRIREIIKTAAETEIRALTLFAFSSENWSRPQKEVDMLMRALQNFLNRHIRELQKNNIKFKIIGRINELPQFLKVATKNAELATESNSGMLLILAFNYGARQEIVDAVRKIALAVAKGEIEAQDINENNFGQFLYTSAIPDPDFLIRTSGELRLSNFLLWQLSYAELYFPRKFWPEFKAQDFLTAIKEYQRRQRRFGGINAQEKDN
jgi:undecaprenyl diphosphate synthase